MGKTYSIFAMSEAVSPISHMKGVEGNESLIAREPVVTPAGVRFIPVLSGNCLRHRLIRDPGAWFLIDSWELAGKMSLAHLNFLFHGGNLTAGGARENTGRIADMERLFPLIRLLGGSLPDQILSGSLLAWRGTMVCEENRGRINRLAPDGWCEGKRKLRAAESFVDGYQYTRGDAAKTAHSALAPGQHSESSNLMIFSGQSVLSGAMFAHGFVLQNVSDLELGALLLSLRLWQGKGGTVGGQSARGHGRLATSLHVPESVNEDACVAAYVDQVRSVKAEAIAFLESCFGSAKTEKTKPKKGGKSAAPDQGNLLA